MSIPRPDEVHVWSIPLERGDEVVARLGAWLAPDERARADRFVFPRDRRRFTVARAALRAILSGYLGRDPAAVGFAYGERGKPRLVESGRLDFNLAHSHELALCAVTAGRAVGVDLEWLRPVSDLLAVARTAFSPAERAALLARPEEERMAVFYRCWVGKEAYVKARGDGLSLPLDSFDIALGADWPALLANRLDPAEPSRWSFVGLAPGEGYVGALAVEGPTVRVRPMAWDGATP